MYTQPIAPSIYSTRRVPSIPKVTPAFSDRSSNPGAKLKPWPSGIRKLLLPVFGTLRPLTNLWFCMGALVYGDGRRLVLRLSKTLVYVCHFSTNLYHILVLPWYNDIISFGHLMDLLSPRAPNANPAKPLPQTLEPVDSRQLI